jgi:phosphatidylglycerophosphate synthase
MDLHQTSGRPDWEIISPEDRNFWQNKAATTKGIITPANAATIIGFGLVLYGLLHIGWHHYWLGLSIIAIGRLFDVLDGWLAQKTGTKSHLGESLDAIADKLGTFATLVVFFTSHIVAGWLLLVIVLPHLIMPFLTLAGTLWRKPVHPTRIGKLGMALTWVCLVAFIILKAANADGGMASGLFYVLAIIGAGMALMAAAITKRSLFK